MNIIRIILGVIAGGGSDTVLPSAGFAASMTESISMGAVGYTSTVEDLQTGADTTLSVDRASAMVRRVARPVGAARPEPTPAQRTRRSSGRH